MASKWQHPIAAKKPPGFYLSPSPDFFPYACHLLGYRWRELGQEIPSGSSEIPLLLVVLSKTMQEASLVKPFIYLYQRAGLHFPIAVSLRIDNSCWTPEWCYFCQETTEQMTCSSFGTLMSSKPRVEIAKGSSQIIQGEKEARQKSLFHSLKLCYEK